MYVHMYVRTYGNDFALSYAFNQLNMYIHTLQELLMKVQVMSHIFLVELHCLLNLFAMLLDFHPGELIVQLVYWVTF